ncbi:MAG: tandem-95 repeat protein, partial [Candidatus Nitrosopelagicus sp.]|nr:tandem-95 repeat protein [Candidatus Nitrosopelagicus sp.]
MLIISGSFALSDAFAEQYIHDSEITGNFDVITGEDIVVDSSGNFFISSEGVGKITKYTQNGIKLLEFDGSSIPDFPNLVETGLPRGLAIDSENNVYVAWADYNRITKHDSEGNFLLQISGTGPDANGGGTIDDEDLRFPHAVAVDTFGNIYVSDVVNKKLKVFDSNGNFLRIFKTYDSATESPYGIILDSINNVYVLNRVSLEKFSNDGTSLQVNNFSQTNSHIGITSDDSGNILIVTQNAGFQKFDSSLNLITSFQPIPVANNNSPYPEGMTFFGGKLFTVGLELQSYVINTIPNSTFSSFEVDEDSEKEFLLTAQDPNSEQQLTFTIISEPTNGNLIGNAPNLTYSPNDNFHGTDNFTFKINDGFEDSVIETVSISISSVNDPPTAAVSNTSTTEDTPVSILLGGSDIDGDSLIHSVVTNPTHGTISGTAPHLTYSPNNNFHGIDNISIKANDGTVDSVIETATIIVTPVNDIPVANAGSDQSVNPSISVTLDGSQSSDVDGDSITYSWIQTSGTPVTLSDDTIVNPQLSTPSTDDTLSFMLTVSDGTATSNPDVVNIYIGSPVPDPIPPPPPTSLSTTSLDGSVSLSWQSPTDNGGETITDYIIEFKKESDSTWQVYADATTPTTSTTISGLTNDENYQFRISSVSLAGVGDTSSLISETPEPTVEETPEPTVETTPEPTVETTPEPTVETTPEPTVETTPEPTSKEILSFVDTTKDPKTYIERYVQEPSYKEWFDSNYPDYTIYEGIGITEDEYLIFVDSFEKPVVIKSQEMIVDPEPTSDIKNQEPTCGAGTIVKDGICVVDIVDPEPTSDIKNQEPTCGAGTIVKDGICVV